MNRNGIVPSHVDSLNIPESLLPDYRLGRTIQMDVALDPRWREEHTVRAPFPKNASSVTRIIIILRGVGGVCFVLLWPFLWPVLMITAGLKMFHFGTKLLHLNEAMGTLFWLVSVGCAAGAFSLSNKKSKRSEEYFSGSRLHLDFFLMNSLWLIVMTATLFEVTHLLMQLWRIW
jgi:hypothetical protein